MLRVQTAPSTPNWRALVNLFFVESQLFYLIIFCCVLGSCGQGDKPDRTRPVCIDDRLPRTIVVDSGTGETSRGWTTKDIIEVRDITEVSVSENRQVAFILRQSFVNTNVVRYGLYVLNHGGSGSEASKLAESSYIADLSWRSGKNVVTVTTDLDHGGTQVYDIDLDAKATLVVKSDVVVQVGGYEAISDSFESHKTGIISYQWAPDGLSLWYTTIRLRSTLAQKRMDFDGIVYDDSSMVSSSPLYDQAILSGVELHLYTPTARTDRIVQFLPSSAFFDRKSNFSRSGIRWWPDSRHIEFPMLTNTPNVGDSSLRVADTSTGSTETLAESKDTNHRQGSLEVKARSNTLHLFQMAGNEARDYGAVGYLGIEDVWWDRSRARAVLLVRYRDHFGLSSFPFSVASSSLESIPDDIDHCAFTTDLSYGACVRQNVVLPPELVAVSEQGTLSTILRPNASYDAIKPLSVKQARWINRFGDTSYGYITYPRERPAGGRSPIIVITHDGDAKNKFAWDEFQWEFPLQVLAEHGYVVLSVNDPTPTKHRPTSAIEEAQFERGLDAVASMEAAVRAAIEQRIGDASKTGIAGYSAGSEIVRLTMTHSKIFRAGISADGAGYDAGMYWKVGNKIAKDLYGPVFGGSPFDPEAAANYRRFSPTVRARECAGPLLQIYPGATAMFGLEMLTLLRDAKIPTELVVYPGETHIFEGPRHRFSAMELTIRWFNYWLLGRKDPDPQSQQRYRSWDLMAAEWKANRG